jgi:carbonic anhydrase/acetyltransferase-like protein (isoleucine patch superfamily)
MPCFALDGFAPELPPSQDHWIAPTATLIGRVKLEKDASVWFGAVLRGDNDFIHIGGGSNIQDNSTLHTDEGFPLRIGTGCTVGHNAIVHACTVGDNTLIGMGAVILTGARIGRDCLIGAKALVAENKEIPDGSLVLGAPGRVVRALDDRTIAEIAGSARHYVKNWKRFAAGLAALA